MEEDCGSVGQGELVVAGGQGPPLLEGVEAAFHDVAAHVRFPVVGHRPAAGLSLPLAVVLLVLTGTSE